MLGSQREMERLVLERQRQLGREPERLECRQLRLLSLLFSFFSRPLGGSFCEDTFSPSADILSYIFNIFSEVGELVV